MGVTNRALIRRLRAWSVGAPVARGTTIHTHISKPESRFLLAFVRMGGESRPWGVAWKKGTATTKFRSVGEPRVREFVDEMLLELAADLSEHLWHPEHYEFDQPTAKSPIDVTLLPQVWVPNSSHIDMLHFLAYSYTRRSGEGEDDLSLRLLGRTAMHLFLESRRPGQQIVLDASRALRSAFDFPCEDARQAHLGLLVAWLENRGHRDRGIQAALMAERESVGTSMNPALERDPLTDLVEQYNASRKNRGRGNKSIESRIGAVLRSELERRIGLVDEAIRQLDSDERMRNRGLDELCASTAADLWWNYWRPENRALEEGREPFPTHPETDWDARGAAARFFRVSAALDRETNALIHHDRELEAEAINSGRAFRGIITEVTDEGTGRKTEPVWSIVDATPGALSLRPGDKVCVVGTPQRTASIRDASPLEDGGMQLTIEIEGWKTAKPDLDWPHRMAPADQSWLGQAVTIIGTSFANMTDRKASLAIDRTPAPGDWMLERLSRQPRTATEDQ